MMKIDFHIHTQYSFDSTLSLETIAGLCRCFGIEGIAITDHDTLDGFYAFQELKTDLYLICGQEITTNQGDIIGLFLKEKVPCGGRVTEVIDCIHAQGGLAVLAHPYKWPHLVRDPRLLARFDAIEVFNARNNIPMPRLENGLARRAVERYHLNFLAGSDAHEGFELGHAATIFDFSKDKAHDEAIRAAILERRLKVEGREVSLAREVISHFTRLVKKGVKKG